MIDFEQIGKRIQEERKFLRRISQERMAEDLGMYQADISNLEKAKNGSGITDLSKLDMIAEYFDMPLETLLFGRRQDQMKKYYGAKMQIKESKKKRTRKHETILRGLMGLLEDDTADAKLAAVRDYECGPYMIYTACEYQVQLSGDPDVAATPPDSLLKLHLYVVYQDEVISCATASATTVMEHVFQPSFEKLKSFIHPDVFDINDTMAILNPNWLLYQYALDEEEKETYQERMLRRMNELRSAGEDRIIFYVENAYVREDCRRNGMLRMMIDVLRTEEPSAMIWMNLEPTSGAELNSEYDFFPAYEASELGQISLNASIAEHLGFSVDPKTVDRKAERVEEDGTVVIDTVPVRRTAYYLPKKIRSIIVNDSNVLANARARKRVIDGGEDVPIAIDIYQSAWKKYGFIIAIKLDYVNETVYAFARGTDWESRWLGVSLDNPSPHGDFVETMERYDRLEDATESKYYIGLKVAEQLLGAIFFNTVDPKSVELEKLQP